jgi:pantetheine-phosphate adenylyltransferase
MATTACYPGSFDPLTRGHLDLIERGARLFDHLVVAIGESVGKESLFEVVERIAFIRAEIGHLEARVEVAAFGGLVVDFCRSRGISILLRGLRTVSDFEAEMAMAHANRRLAPDIETILFMPSERHAFLSSRLVKEIVRAGGSVDSFVTPGVEAALRRRLVVGGS